MSYFVKYDDIQTVHGYAASKLQDMQDKLKGIVESLNAVAGAPGFEGAAAGKAKQYLSDVHSLMWDAIQTIFADYQSLILLYKDGYHNQIDSDPHAEFNEDELGDSISAFSKVAADFDEEARELERAVDMVADLLSFHGPTNANAVHFNFVSAKTRVQDLKDKVGSYEHSHASDLADVEANLADLNALLSQYAGTHGSMMTSYQRADLASNPNAVSIFQRTEAMKRNQQDRAVDVQEALGREKQRAKVLEEEAARERVKWGWIKAVGALVTIAVGVIVVVASAGAATPLVVVGAAALSTVFGASDLVEAAGDIYYGSKGDAHTQAFNPLRDTVFQGNQTLYDIVGGAVTTVGSAGLPMASMARAGTLSRSAAVKVVGREFAEDLVAQKATEAAAPYLGGEGSLAAGMLGGMAAGKIRGPKMGGVHVPTKATTASVPVGPSAGKLPEVPTAAKPRAQTPASRGGSTGARRGDTSQASIADPGSQGARSGADHEMPKRRPTGGGNAPKSPSHSPAGTDSSHTVFSTGRAPDVHGLEVPTAAAVAAPSRKAQVTAVDKPSAPASVGDQASHRPSGSGAAGSTDIPKQRRQATRPASGGHPLERLPEHDWPAPVKPKHLGGEPVPKPDFDHLESFRDGRLSFDEVKHDYARLYVHIVRSPRKLRWLDMPGASKLKPYQRKQIRQLVREEYMPPVPRKGQIPGAPIDITLAPDFDAAGVVFTRGGKKAIFTLPEGAHKLSDKAQFDMLDKRLQRVFGLDARPEGYTWHHSELTGRMELVETGVHNITPHRGGRAPGGWAAGKR